LGRTELDWIQQRIEQFGDAESQREMWEACEIQRAYRDTARGYKDERPLQHVGLTQWTNGDRYPVTFDRIMTPTFTTTAGTTVANATYITLGDPQMQTGVHWVAQGVGIGNRNAIGRVQIDDDVDRGPALHGGEVDLTQLGDITQELANGVRRDLETEENVRDRFYNQPGGLTHEAETEVPQQLWDDMNRQANQFVAAEYIRTVLNTPTVMDTYLPVTRMADTIGVPREMLGPNYRIEQTGPETINIYPTTPIEQITLNFDVFNTEQTNG
jgi:hypothetical protein